MPALGYDPNVNKVCFCFPLPFFLPPVATSTGGGVSSASLAPTASSCAGRPGAHADVGGGALPRICCIWLERAETTGRDLGAAELGNVGNAAFDSAGAGGGGTGGGFPPCDNAGVLLAVLLPPLPALTLAADADHAVLRVPRLRLPGVGPGGRGCGAWSGVEPCDGGCCCCCRGRIRRGGKVAPRSAACATRSKTARWGGNAR